MKVNNNIILIIDSDCILDIPKEIRSNNNINT